MPRPRRRPINNTPDPRRTPGLNAPPRRPSCLHYSLCLDQAARVDAMDLGCAGCDRFTPMVLPHKQAMADAEGARALLLAAYAPIPADAPGGADFTARARS